jgi:hypothetical protein
VGLQRMVCGAVEKRLLSCGENLRNCGGKYSRVIEESLCSSELYTGRFVLMKCFLEKRLLNIKERLYTVQEVV